MAEVKTGTTGDNGCVICVRPHVCVFAGACVLHTCVCVCVCAREREREREEGREIERGRACLQGHEGKRTTEGGPWH